MAGAWAEALLVDAGSQDFLLDGVHTLLAPGFSPLGPISQIGARRAEKLDASRTASSFLP